MDSVIYLEPDEEITSVIEKLKRSKSPIVGIVAPRNAVLLQSVVNLKLLKRQAAALKKDIALVTADRIGQNLALRTGLTVFANVHDTEPLEPLKGLKPESLVEDEIKKPPAFTSNAFKVHRYDEEPELSPDASETDPSLDEDDSIENLQAASNFSSRPLSSEEDEDTQIFEKPEPIEKKDEEPENIDEPKILKKPEKILKSEEKSDQSKEDTVKIEEFRPSAALKTTRVKANFLKLGLVLIVFLSVVAIIGYLALSSVSRASVNIVVSSEPVNQPIEFSVMKDRTSLDAAKNLIPGRLVESTQQSTQTFKATGKKDVGTKAVGKMTVSNATGVSQSFEANTAFKSPDNLIFRSNKAFTVPPATAAIDKHGNLSKINGTITIDVTADQPGETYNINSAAYTLSGYSLVTGQGADMTGGDTKEVTIVSQSDISKATDTITRDLIAKGLADLKQKAGNAVFLDKAIKNEIIDTSSDAEAGDQAVDFNLTANIKSSNLVFDKNNLEDLITQILKSKIPAGKSLLTTDTKDLKIELVSSDPPAGILKLSTIAKGKIIPNINKNKVRFDLAGKTQDQVKSYFANTSDIEQIDIKLSPSWWLKSIPKTSQKITIDIQTK